MSKKQKAQKQTAMDVMQALAKANGGTITPEALVDAARDKESPLHEYFEWDDATAAHQYRLEQARRMIRACHVKEIIRKETLEIPYFVKDPAIDQNEPGYRETAKVATDEDFAQTMILREIISARGQLKRVSNFAKYVGVGSDVDDLIDRLDKIYRRVERPLDIAV
jgi:hypothetical protein